MGENGIGSRLWEYAPLIVGVPLYVWVAIFALRTFRDWGGIMARWNERRRDAASEKAGDWQRLREERDYLRQERDHCRELLKQCESERIELLHRATRAEAALQGEGDAMQRAQIMLSAEREEDAKKRGKPND